VDDSLEAGGVAFRSDLLAQLFHPVAPLEHDDTHGLAGECLELDQFLGEQDGSKVGDAEAIR
jgi:hypothetical protein